MRRTLSSLAIAVVATAGGLGASSAVAAPHDGATVDYLALGDSYPAGEGAGHALSYPVLLASSAYASVDLTDQAVAGHVTSQVVAGLPATPDLDTDIVTLTVGANDLDWGGLVVGDPLALANLPMRLAALAGTAPVPVTGPHGRPVLSIAAVLGAVQQRNPGARILVTGYPMPVGEVTGVCDVGGGVTLTAAQAQGFTTVTAQLNRIIAASVAGVAAKGVNATYVDVTGTFEGHGLCDTERPWLYDVDDPTVVGPPAPAHLTPRGQKAYAQTIADAGFRSTALAVSRPH